MYNKRTLKFAQSVTPATFSVLARVSSILRIAEDSICPMERNIVVYAQMASIFIQTIKCAYNVPSTIASSVIESIISVINAKMDISPSSAQSASNVSIMLYANEITILQEKTEWQKQDMTR